MNNPAVDRLPEQTAQCGISWEALRSGGHICGAAPFSGRHVGVFAALKCSGRSTPSCRDSHSGDGSCAHGRGAHGPREIKWGGKRARNGKSKGGGRVGEGWRDGQTAAILRKRERTDKQRRRNPALTWVPASHTDPSSHTTELTPPHTLVLLRHILTLQTRPTLTPDL